MESITRRTDRAKVCAVRRTQYLHTVIARVGNAHQRAAVTVAVVVALHVRNAKRIRELIDARAGAATAVAEGGASVWAQGAFVAGTPGVLAGADDGDFVTFTVTSGAFIFLATA